MLGRAVGLKADRKPLIWDATGGLGRDAFVLADLGCEVTLCERMPYWRGCSTKPCKPPP